jgi:hypothetical protein
MSYRICALLDGAGVAVGLFVIEVGILVDEKLMVRPPAVNLPIKTRVMTTMKATNTCNKTHSEKV